MREASGGGPACSASGTSETKCSDGADDDCDGYPDCLDPDCDGKACGSGTGSSCAGGACLGPGNGGLPDLPRINNVRVSQPDDTTIGEFEPVSGALDSRIYPLPKQEDVLVRTNSHLALKHPTYRCS